MIDFDDDDVPGVYTDNLFLILQWWYAVNSNQLYMPTRFEGMCFFVRRSENIFQHSSNRARGDYAEEDGKENRSYNGYGCG